jgi:hypothetical protein
VKLRILISFHYYKTTDIGKMVAAFPEPPEIFADSGGFSAYSQGASVSVAEYAEWLHRWEHLINVYANLDEIGDAEGTLANQEALEAEGLTPIPVFHAGGPPAALEAYCERYSYVALGGMVPISADLALRWGVGCFKIGRKYGTRFHGFGQTSVKVMRALPFYSVDSSSWGGGHRFGQLQLWDDKRVRFVTVSLGDHAGIYKLAPLIREHGGDPVELASKDFGKMRNSGKTTEVGRRERATVIGVNVAAWLRLEAWLRHHHGPVSAPRDWASAPGPHVHLAGARPTSNSDSALRYLDVTTGAHAVSPPTLDDGVNVSLALGWGVDADLAVLMHDGGPKVYLADTNSTSGGSHDLPKAAHTLDASGAKVYLAATCGGAKTNPDLGIAAHQLEHGPKVYLADTAKSSPRTDPDLAVAQRAMSDGPKVYFAEGAADNLTMAGQAADRLYPKEKP